MSPIPRQPRGPLWTREETMIAFNLYSKMRYGQIHDYHPDIVNLAKKINRPPASLSLKMCNLASQDPQHIGRIKGTRIAKMEREVWAEFNANPGKFMLESEKLYLAAMGKRQKDPQPEPEFADLPEGKTRQRLVNVRVNQSLFRKVVLSAYDNRCCITDIAVPELLNASHIKPWREDLDNGINPRNGLCLNVLHDRAFDRGLISVTPDLIVHVAPKLLEAATTSEKIQFIIESEGMPIAKPERFAPDQDFLDYHYHNVFQNY